MKTSFCVSVGVGLWLSVVSLWAQTPAPSAVTGRVLVLENGRTITGEIERDGDRYRVRRLTGETTVPTTGVLRLCNSLDEALNFLRSRTNLRDADERLRLADWCANHSLREQQIVEIEAALKLRPEDNHIRRLHRSLLEAKRRVEAPVAAAPTEPSPPRVEVSLETLSTFASKVQPILLNACAKCHNPARPSRFQLRTPISPGLADRRTIDHNLAALVAWLDPTRPSASALLTKAVTSHAPGMVAPPLSVKTHATALHTLENWTHQLLRSTPGLRPESPSPPTTSATTASATSGSSHFAALKNPTLTPSAPTTPSGGTRSPNPTLKQTTSPSPFGADRPEDKPKETESEDPLGPEEFNRQAHPMKKPSEAATPAPE